MTSSSSVPVQRTLRFELIISGYIRELEHHYRHLHVPPLVADLLLQYYSLLLFGFHEHPAFDFDFELEGDDDNDNDSNSNSNNNVNADADNELKLKARLKHKKYGTLLFGDLLSHSQSDIFTVHFNIHDMRGNNSGFGLCTAEYVEYETGRKLRDYEKKNPQRCMLAGCAYFMCAGNQFVCTKPEAVKHTQTVSKNLYHQRKINATNINKNKKRIVAVHVNMIEKIGRIWNVSHNENEPRRWGDVGATAYLSEENPFEVKIVADQVRICIMIGNVMQSVSVEEQWFGI